MLIPSYSSAAPMGSSCANTVLASKFSIRHSRITILFQKFANAVFEFILFLFSRLLKRSNPLAIFWRIVPIVVLSVQSRSVWPIAHIFEKQFIGRPSGTNRYSSPAIPLPFISIWVITTLSHLLPRTISFRFIGKSVRPVHVARNLFPMASAGLSFSCSQFQGIYGSSFSTFASAIPNCTRRMQSIGFSDYGKLPKFLTRQVNCSHLTHHKIDGCDTDTLYHRSVISAEKIKGKT